MIPVFGSAPAGVPLRQRHAAYAVISDAGGRVATVREFLRGGTFHWLPGGGVEAGETEEAAVLREIGEEIGHRGRLVTKIGQAIQFFHAADQQQWYEMPAGFYRVELEEGPCGPAQYEVCWLDPRQDADMYFHVCHAWAARGCPDLHL